MAMKGSFAHKGFGPGKRSQLDQNQPVLQLVPLLLLLLRALDHMWWVHLLRGQLPPNWWPCNERI